MTTLQLTVIHFNDVYNVEKSPRFIHELKKATAAASANSSSSSSSQQQSSSSSPIFRFFSGDAFSPSTLSAILRGMQMPPILNTLSIDAACLGNHDLDFGLTEFEALRRKCDFPWLCSNARGVVVDDDDGRRLPLGGCLEYVILRKGGLKLLVLGLIEEDWIATLPTVEAEDIEYEDYCEYVKRRVPELKKKEEEEEGGDGGSFDLVVALTHMRMPSDYDLAEDCGGLIDIILGGHDHHYESTIVNGVPILNSGTDFRDFSIVRVNGRGDDDDGRRLIAEIERVPVGEEGEIDAEASATVASFKDEIDKAMDVVVGRTKVDLDARFSRIRTGETNFSNFVASLMARATGSDVALLNAGVIRADRIISKGELKVRDLSDLLPKAEELATVEITGERLLLALENGVSKYPAMEGRFPCVDGIKFAFDPSKPPGERVSKDSVYVRRTNVNQRFSVIKHRGKENNNIRKSIVNDEDTEFAPLNLDESYTLVSTAYLLKGKDGYDEAFDGLKVLDEEKFPDLCTVLRNIFTEIGALERWHSFMKGGATTLKAANIFKKNAGRVSKVDPFAISPQVDGRIVNLASA